MTCQRKIPFGYKMAEGEYMHDEKEAQAVKDIFALYMAGGSLQSIAETMEARGIRYHASTCLWNKSMVKRILENRRYLGDESHPPIIIENDYLAVQRMKKGRNVHAPSKVGLDIREKTVCDLCGARIRRNAKYARNARWECENRDCGHKVFIDDERLTAQIDVLLSKLAQSPQNLEIHLIQTVRPGSDALRISNELTNALNRGTDSTEYLKSLIFACAAERYSELPDRSLQYKINKLRAQMESGDSDETLRQELLKTTVRAIRLTDPDNIALELINGQIITKESTES